MSCLESTVYSARTVSPQFPLCILYEEGPCLAVNKPSGLLTQAPVGIDSLETQVRAYIIEKEGRGENGYVGTPHRLDRVASGVILFGKHSRATKRLSEQFEARTIEKTYWVLVEGWVESAGGVWTDYMRKIPNQPRAELVPPIDPDAREAILQYQVLERLVHTMDGHAGVPLKYSWLEIQLQTGRMHQIRLQAATRGFPILGDSQYGSQVIFGHPYSDERLRGAALHARSLRCTHPMTREPVHIVAPLPESWTPFTAPRP